MLMKNLTMLCASRKQVLCTFLNISLRTSSNATRIRKNIESSGERLHERNIALQRKNVRAHLDRISKHQGLGSNNIDGSSYRIVHDHKRKLDLPATYYLPNWIKVFDAMIEKTKGKTLTSKDFIWVDEMCKISEKYDKWPTSCMVALSSKCHVLKLKEMDVSSVARALMDFTTESGLEVSSIMRLHFLSVLGMTDGKEAEAEILLVYDQLMSEQFPDLLAAGLSFSIANLLSLAFYKTSQNDKCWEIWNNVTQRENSPKIPITICCLTTLMVNRKDIAESFSFLDDKIKELQCKRIDLNGIEILLESTRDDKHLLDQLISVLSENHILCDEKEAADALANAIIRHLPRETKWESTNAYIPFNSGRCTNCFHSLEINKDLSDEDFEKLKSSYKKIIMKNKKTIYQRSYPEEVERFEKFVEKIGHVDLVIDCLNISYTTAQTEKDKEKRIVMRAQNLDTVLTHLKKSTNMKILAICKEHVQNWPQYLLDKMVKKAHFFYTLNYTEDDLFTVYGALLSGPKTKFLTKDELKDMRANLGEEVGDLFRHWQRCRQLLLYTIQKDTSVSGTCVGKGKFPVIKGPVSIDTKIQKNSNGIWHIPHLGEDRFKIYPFEKTRNWVCIYPVSESQTS